MWAGRLSEVKVNCTLPCLLEGREFSSVTYFPPLIHLKKKKKMPEIELDLVWPNQRLVSSPRAGIPEGLKSCI